MRADILKFSSLELTHSNQIKIQKTSTWPGDSPLPLRFQGTPSLLQVATPQGQAVPNLYSWEQMSLSFSNNII